MPKYTMLKLVTGAVALSFAQTATAAVVIGSNSGGYSTFVDTNTNRQWVKLDSFFNRTSTSMFADVTAAGFTVGTRSDVEQLLNTLQPMSGADWASYAAIMGRAPNRNLIWGAYGPVNGNGDVGWAFAFQGDSNWRYLDNAVSANVVPNGGSEVADMNVWAFRLRDVGAVPEPATWLMMIMGFGLIGASMRRKQQTLHVSYG